MLKYVCLPLAALSLLASPAYAEEETMAVAPELSQEIEITNRILTTVNEKTISVLDVVKRMDLFLSKNYPHILDQPAERFQFYSNQWRHFLNDLINNELILLEAAEKKLSLPEAEVSKVMKERFGANAVLKLEKLGISYEEARKLTNEEMLVSQLSWMFAQRKAIQAATPLEMEKQYHAFLAQKPPKDVWKYEVLTIRTPDTEEAEKLIHLTTNSLKEKGESLVHLAGHIQEKTKAIDPANFSAKEYVVNHKDLSDQHKTILMNLSEGEVSEPCEQWSRADNRNIKRVFRLISHEQDPVPPLEEVLPQLRGNFINQEYDKAEKEFHARLYRQYGFDMEKFNKSIPKSFQPFTMR